MKTRFLLAVVFCFTSVTASVSAQIIKGSAASIKKPLPDIDTGIDRDC